MKVHGSHITCINICTCILCVCVCVKLCFSWCRYVGDSIYMYMWIVVTMTRYDVCLQTIYESTSTTIKSRDFFNPRAADAGWTQSSWTDFFGRPMTDNTVDGTNPAHQLRLVVYPFIPLLFTRFLHPRWLFRISAINSIVCTHTNLPCWALSHIPSQPILLNHDFPAFPFGGICGWFPGG